MYFCSKYVIRFLYILLWHALCGIVHAFLLFVHEKLNYDYQAALKEAKHEKVDIDDEIASLQSVLKVI